LRDRQAIVALPSDRLRRALLRGQGGAAVSFERAANLQLAKLLLDLNRPADAREALTRWLARGEDHGARRLRVAATFALKDYAATIADADALLAADAADDWARSAKASAQIERGAPKDAVRTIEAAPSKPQGALLHMLARAHALAGSIDAATTAFGALYAQSDDKARQRIAADLSSRGYLRAQGAPPVKSQSMQDALRACVIDRRCLIGDVL